VAGAGLELERNILEETILFVKLMSYIHRRRCPKITNVIFTCNFGVDLYLDQLLSQSSYMLRLPTLFGMYING